jgi:N-acetyl sugar amidotransferase
MDREIVFCKKCTYPSIAVNLELDDDGICSSCSVFEDAEETSDSQWRQREDKFIEILEKGRRDIEGDYDCIVPVGGGKDSYWQVHKVKELGFNPLLITYHGNNYLPEGQKNLDRMREVFNVDHYIFYPGSKDLIELNKICFKMMGDMNWHNHAGIHITPVHAAIKFSVPIFIWGETLWDISGMFSPDDFVEYNKRMVLEHDMRGFTREDMLAQGSFDKDALKWLTMPSDKEFSDNNLRGIYLGNYFSWDPVKQTKIIMDKYEWESARLPFERTYRTISNLDDMHENGIHDYMKWIKFGYGRCSDHSSKDIRLGYMSRDEGIEKVREYDHVKPYRDLNRWLEYVDMSEDEFDLIADSFRNPRVWWIKDGLWWKKDVWGGESSYGKVSLSKADQKKYFR